MIAKNIEDEGLEFEDASERACDAHLNDLRIHHTHGCGELKIASSGIYTRFRTHQRMSLGGSPAALCVDANGNGH